jgi:hypothetical protein
VDVELDPEHYHLAINKALEKFRQRSENAVEEDFMFLEIETERDTYRLPDDVISVKDIYGRVSGGISSGVDFEPFEANFFNSYMTGARGGGGSLATYDFLAQHHETLGRLLGAEYTFTWRPQNHTLRLHRRPRAPKSVYLHIYKHRDEEELLSDVYAKPWLKDYALAHSKLMLGEARGKFSVIAGPQGGSTLNGEQLKADAQNELIQLEEDLKMYKDGSAGLGIIIG